jgi:hypothetical protein
VAKLKNWANQHPFTFSALDVKGLEFDDVVVAFKKSRKTWRVDPDRVECLRLLRELYVAVTVSAVRNIFIVQTLWRHQTILNIFSVTQRARRRVVILVSKKQPEMKQFFESLSGCQLEWTEASVIMLEFDNDTTAVQWFSEGMNYFKQEKFSLAKVGYSCDDSGEVM